MTPIAPTINAAHEPVIVLVFGLPGSGKSYFAERLAQKINAGYVSSDKVRHDMQMQGKYSEKAKLIVYKKMLTIMEEHIETGRSVVLDATFFKEKWRNIFRKRALQLHKIVHFISVSADEEVIKQRLSKQRKYSEANFNTYLKVKKNFDAMYDYHLSLYSDRSTIAEMLNRALIYIGLYE